MQAICMLSCYRAWSSRAARLGGVICLRCGNITSTACTYTYPDHTNELCSFSSSLSSMSFLSCVHVRQLRPQAPGTHQRALTSCSKRCTRCTAAAALVLLRWAGSRQSSTVPTGCVRSGRRPKIVDPASTPCTGCSQRCWRWRWRRRALLIRMEACCTSLCASYFS